MDVVVYTAGRSLIAQWCPRHLLFPLGGLRVWLPLVPVSFTRRETSS
jgi:hypothetical protein